MLHNFRLRCHPIRCIRYGLLLVGAVFTILAIWRFLSNGEASSLHHRNDMMHDDYAIDESEGVNKLKVAAVDPHASIVKRSHMSKLLKLDAQKPIQVDETAQLLIDYIADYLDVHYDVVSNEGGRFHVDLKLTNTGTEAIQPCCFSIFFAHMKFIDTFSFNAGVSVPLRDDDPANMKQRPANFALSHINGYTFQLQPTKLFVGLQPGSTEVLRISGGGWSVSRGEVLPNWYVAGDVETTEPRIIKSTTGEEMSFVGEFDSIEKSIRGDGDMYRPFSPEIRYQRNKVLTSSIKIHNSIIPTPLIVKQQELDKRVSIDDSWKVVHSKELQQQALYVKGALHLKTIERSSVGDSECEERSILLSLSSDEIEFPADVDSAHLLMDEAYTLSVSAERNCITIKGLKPAGVFYGAVSLISLAHGSALQNNAVKSGYSVDCLELTDAPRFEYRGVMVDVARNFHTVGELLKLIDNMALYKLNKLHLHLSDDEGWRLEIPSLEELVQVGSRRGHDVKERYHLMSMLGSGPFTNSSGSGFYSVEEYRAVLRHAVSRHVEIVPEFDMPSHSHAAIKSMERRYKRLRQSEGVNTEGDEGKDSGHYLLTDLEDESVYMTGQFFKDSAINPCIESSYRFVSAVMSAVIIMHRDIMPLRRWHFGGDEVPQDAYTASPACFKFMQKHRKLKSTKDLKTYFVRRVVALAAHHGLSIYGWDDAFTSHDGGPIPRNELKNELDVVSQAYYNTWESGAASKAYDFANRGYKVVLSPLTALYFDNPQEPDPEDWGLHWATRFVDIKRAFRFTPDSIYDSIDEEFWGQPTSKHQLCDNHRINCIALQHRENILGIEAVLWSELVRTSDRLDSMLWPRLLAVAERSWHKASWELVKNMETSQSGHTAVNNTAFFEDWARFVYIVGHKELRRLDAQGVHYYLPRPGARTRSGKLFVNTAFPGLTVQVSSDNGKTWSDFNKSKGVPYTGQLLLATRSHDRKRRSVPVKITMS